MYGLRARVTHAQEIIGCLCAARCFVAARTLGALDVGSPGLMALLQRLGIHDLSHGLSFTSREGLRT